MNLDIFNRLNDVGKGTNNFVKDFINELQNYLYSDRKIYTVAGITKDNDYYVVCHDAKNYNDKTVNHPFSDKVISKDDKRLPIDVQFGTKMRNINGKFVIDEKLTKESIDGWNQAKIRRDDILRQEKEEGVDYLVKQKYQDGFELENQKTGYVFSVENFDTLLEKYDKIEENMMLTYKDGEYVLKEDG